MLGAIVFTETTLKLWKNLFEKWWELVTNNAFKYFTDDKEHTYWSVIVLNMRAFFLKTGVIDAIFKEFGDFSLFKNCLKYLAI